MLIKFGISFIYNLCARKQAYKYIKCKLNEFKRYLLLKQVRQLLR